MLPPPSRQSFPDGDAAIRSTDDDAAHARVSAVRKGYLKDPYIQYLVPRSHLIPTRPPLINIGTYIRSEVIDRLVIKWLELLEDSSGAQIDHLLISKLSKYIEVDFPEIVTKKAMSIRKQAALNKALGQDVKIEKGGTVLRSQVYSILSADLRGRPSEALQPLEDLVSIDQPVLLLAECVFPYMSPELSTGIIRWFSERCPRVSLVSYDMFGLGDSFGKVMRDNLKIRNIELLGVDDLSTKQSLESRMSRAGLPATSSLTLEEARKSCLSGSESERLSHVEILDEVEELDLVLSHYAISWGSSDNKLRDWNPKV
ncbi:carboxy methyl transferase for protein phosphatase 2A [Tulasnella sp. 427]|nr:carboxy methyl transferase for protein phosphatase 2A [Tulasnella sp. 427]